MNKTAIMIITILLLSMAFPNQLFAESKVDESEVTVNQDHNNELPEVKNSTQELEVAEEGDKSTTEQETDTSVPKKKREETKEVIERETKEETALDTSKKINEGTEEQSPEDIKIIKDETDNVKEEDNTTINEENVVDTNLNQKELDTDNKSDKTNIKNRTSIHTLAAPKTLAIEDINKGKTSKLGHIQSSSVKIYDSLTNLSQYKTAGESYTNQVYYIKEQAVAGSQTYYLISLEPSRVSGVVGWVKAEDLSTYSHTGVESKTKTLYIKGTGIAYSKAWGGSKNLVYGDMSQFANQEFTVHLTEAVGSNIWYRGQLNGETIWLHEAYVITHSQSQSHTSKLGHIVSSSVKIFTDPSSNSSYKIAGKTYTNQVYYIKEQAVTNGQTYYLISLEPSRVSGVVGWVKAEDLSTYSHTGVDSKTKTLYIKGTGSAYSKAWGGPKDLVYADMSQFANQEFTVHLTEAVGSNIWYRGQLNGEIIWLHEAYVITRNRSHTSELGHIVSSSVKIFTNPSSNSSYKTAGEIYINQVYYIKEQAVTDGQTYYLISSEPSRVSGVVGWVKAEDLSTYSHTGVDSKTKTLYIKGTGSAYSKAWGGSKDLVYADMSQFVNQEFTVHLTEAVGSNIWYRGQLNGKTIWLHEAYVKSYVQSHASKLGHIRSANVKIYNGLESNSSYKVAGEQYTNQVYYIKEQAVSKDQTYYLISLEPSRERGVVGWVKAKDLSTNPHLGVDSKAKIFSIISSGNAYNKAWGGEKNIVYSDLSSYKNDQFNVNLTERVGANIWYRGILDGKQVWIHESFLKEIINTNTEYSLTFDEALQAQLRLNNPPPQTTNEYKTYVSKRYINDKGVVYNAEVLNVRGGPSTSNWVVGQITEGTQVTILDEINGWYQIEYTNYYQFVNASSTDLAYYLNPNNFITDTTQKFQFLDLSLNSSTDAANLNKILSGDGILEGMGGAFIEAGIKYHVNDVYLVSHAKLETGNGTSELATGISRWVKRDMSNHGGGKIVRDADGEPIIIDISPRKVYNTYGIGAFDDCAFDCGAQTAYNNGWFDIGTAIIEGARFIGKNYVNAGQNTLYEMRWNYGLYGNATHQYATDIGWASKQVFTMYNLYQKLGSYVIYLDVPVYKQG